MKHSLWWTSAGLIISIASALDALPVQAQTTPITYDYRGSFNLTSNFFGPPDASDIFAGSVSVTEDDFLDGRLRASAREIFELIDVPLTSNLENQAAFLLGMNNPTRHTITSVFSGAGSVSSDSVLLSNFKLSTDISLSAPPDAILVADLIADFDIPEALSTCAISTCSAMTSFSILLTIQADIFPPSTTTALAGNLFVETTPRLADPSIPKDGALASVPEPAAVLGLMGLGGWFINTRQRQTKRQRQRILIANGQR